MPELADDPITLRNPADVREVVANYRPHTQEEVAQACERGAVAARRWGARQGPDRGAVLHQAAVLLEHRVEELARRITLEEGKILSDAAAEVRRAVAVLRFHAGEAERLGGEITDAAQASTLTWTRKRPLGVVGLITPWNFPIAIPAWKLAPAIASGNAVVVKPSSQAPGAVLGLAETLHEAGVPPDVLQVVIGGAQAAETIADHEQIRAVSFTGSNVVGQALSRRLSARGVRFQGELGGNNPLVVLADADVQGAAELACEGAFLAAGQKCTATRRVIVEKPVYGPLLEAMNERAGRMVVGNGLEQGVEVPPLISSRAVSEVLGAVEQATQLGARIISGGSRAEADLIHGNFVAPTLLTDVSAGMKVVDEEVFGPVCAIVPAADDVEAVRLANSVPYGLSASVCTTDLGRAFRFIECSDAGMVHVNRATPGADPHMPFGGLKASSASGYREQGHAGVRFFTEEQTVSVHWEVAEG